MTWIARCLTWCAACGGYVLFTGQPGSVHELVTAAVLATGATLWASALRRCGHRQFALSPAHAREWAKAVVALGPALVRTAGVFAKAALLGGSPGRLLELRFERGDEEGARDGARRASAVLIASLGPDNFVVRAPQGEDRVLMHAILPRQNAARDRRWLNP